MLIYRGDKFVKGKKFNINESVYKFDKRDRNNNLIFESIKTKEKLKLTEAEAIKMTRYNVIKLDDVKELNENYIVWSGASASTKSLDTLYNNLLKEGVVDSCLTLPIYNVISKGKSYVALNKLDLNKLDSPIFKTSNK